ncbi:hypothetical protein HWV62_28497 [Athelia sp. TMB]|nr:hypothetical protein HWV62_28497 [Athelia sp. TMB]
MAKHARKRQRTDAAASTSTQPLGSKTALTDGAKDDEERRLESLLFGVPFVPSGDEEDEGGDEAGQDDEGETAGKELDGLLDTDLFYVDSGEPSTSYVPAISDSDDESSPDEPEESEKPGDNDIPVLASSSKAPAWVDPDDATLQVSLAADKRLRKLRDAPDDDALGGREYERRLRRQYEKIHPAPAWAGKSKKRRAAPTSSATPSDDEGEDIFASTAGILGGAPRGRLAKETLAIERLRDANHAAPAEGAVKTVRFHPSPNVPLLMAASADRRVRLFTVDGHTNPLLSTIHIPSLPLSHAHFHPSGTSVLLTGPRPFFYTLDLQSGISTRSSPLSSFFADGAGAGMELCAFDPTGAVLAVAARRGVVHLLDWAHGAQPVAQVKMHAGVRALWWRDSALMGLGGDGEVYTWDVGTRRCVGRWKDEDAWGGTVLEGSADGGMLAIGATSGFVNLYSGTGEAGTAKGVPKKLKVLGNLTTPISTLRFNADSQLLAIASSAKKDQMRLVSLSLPPRAKALTRRAQIHTQSMTAYANWPTSNTPLGHVSSVDFSRGGEYVGVGNTRGRVLLYHLRDYGVH